MIVSLVKVGIFLWPRDRDRDRQRQKHVTCRPDPCGAFGHPESTESRDSAVSDFGRDRYEL